MARRLAGSAAPDGAGLRRGGGEIGEKFVGHVLGDAVDEPRAELGDPAADVRLDVIAQQRAALGVGERHFGPALGEAGDAALAFARDRVPDERDEVGKLDLASEGGGRPARSSS